MHTADTADPPLRPQEGAQPAGRRSLLDTIDSPRAVFALLGGAALVGLGLAFAVVHGLERFGTQATPTRSSDAARDQVTAPISESATTLSPAVQYQEMTAGADHAGSADDASGDTPSEQPLKLAVPYIAPVVRSARSLSALAPAPHVDATTRMEPISRLDAPPVATIARADTRALSAPPQMQIARGAADAEHRIESVLDAAARSGGQPDDALIDAAGAVRAPEPIRTEGVNPAMARRLNEDANRAYWINHDVAEALQLARRAYEANPNDVEIAGNLAFYYLKQTPPHPQAAREVAMRALTANSSRYRTGRLEDWMSLGIASALMGRSQEAERAFLAGAALGNNLERTCRAALNAVATYGEAVRPAASALLRRLDAQGHSDASPYCAWPPDWSLGRRMP